MYVCNRKKGGMLSTSARDNREKGILFPRKLQNINALKRSSIHSCHLVIVLLTCQYLHASHSDYFFSPHHPRQMLCDQSKGKSVL